MSELGDLGAIERRMSSVRAVQQVVHAIWALARAQLPLVERAAAQATTYLDWVDDVVERIAGAPLPSPPLETLHVVLGPERAYCGSLPRLVLQRVPADGDLGLVGNRLIETAARIDALWSRVTFTLPGASAHDEHEEVGRRVAHAVLKHGRNRQVELLYPAQNGRSLHRIVLLAGARTPAPNPPETYSSLPAVLDAAVGEATSSRLAVGVAEALRTEVIARIAAADRARGACERKLDDLTLSWRAARQRRITSELMEVVAGAEIATESQRAPREARRAAR